MGKWGPEVPLRQSLLPAGHPPRDLPPHPARQAPGAPGQGRLGGHPPSRRLRGSKLGAARRTRPTPKPRAGSARKEESRRLSQGRGLRQRPGGAAAAARGAGRALNRESCRGRSCFTRRQGTRLRPPRPAPGRRPAPSGASSPAHGCRPSPPPEAGPAPSREERVWSRRGRPPRPRRSRPLRPVPPSLPPARAEKRSGAPPQPPGQAPREDGGHHVQAAEAPPRRDTAAPQEEAPERPGPRESRLPARRPPTGSRRRSCPPSAGLRAGLRSADAGGRTEWTRPLSLCPQHAGAPFRKQFLSPVDEEL
ncbi:basic salivary proline-rich protein 1-like [Odocoileus virginianus]|uniref:Basic salivary proline-rich protein 1-like n=1 Tax=Odocoileus virginianus TaxID=9874 RepID=A0ABM4IDM4_ODOVR